MSANALTTGSLLSLTSSSASINSTNGLLYVANTGASTNGIVARIQSNSTAGSGLTVRANGNVGIGTTNPGAKLDVGGYGAFASLMGYAETTIAGNLDNITGVQMHNASAGTSADFRFAIFDNNKDDYVAFSMPGDNNSGSLFGSQRNTSAYIFTNGATAERNLTLGTVKASAVILGTNNLERVRVTSDGNVVIFIIIKDCKTKISTGASTCVVHLHACDIVQISSNGCFCISHQ